MIVDGAIAGHCGAILQVAPGRHRIDVRGLRQDFPERDVTLRNRETLTLNW